MPGRESASNRWVRLAAHTIVLGSCAGFFLHAVPGFANPRVLSDVVLSHDSGRTRSTSTSTRAWPDCCCSGYMCQIVWSATRGRSAYGGFGWRFLVVLAVVQGSPSSRLRAMGPEAAIVVADVDVEHVRAHGTA